MNLRNFTLPLNLTTVVRGKTACTPDVTTCSWSCNGCLAPDDASTCPNKDDWGITFDDGPTIYTPPLLDYLKSKNIKATFFVVGSRVIDNPDMLRRIYAEGHQLAVHTWSHTMLTSQTNEQVIAELWWTATAINNTVGAWPKYMRPPYGDIDDRVRGIVRALGMRAVLWIEDTNDWELGEKQTTTHFTPESITATVQGWVANKTNMSVGPITLQHDLYQQSRDLAISSVIPLMSTVYAPKPVSDCLGDMSPYLGVPPKAIAAAASSAAPTASATPAPAPAAAGTSASPSANAKASSAATVKGISPATFSLALLVVVGAVLF